MGWTRRTRSARLGERLGDTISCAGRPDRTNRDAAMLRSVTANGLQMFPTTCSLLDTTSTVRRVTYFYYVVYLIQYRRRDSHALVPDKKTGSLLQTSVGTAASRSKPHHARADRGLYIRLHRRARAREGVSRSPSPRVSPSNPPVEIRNSTHRASLRPSTTRRTTAAAPPPAAQSSSTLGRFVFVPHVCSTDVA